MRDYIKREDAQKITAEWLSGYINDDERNVIEHIDIDLGELPPADVVEVVRCKDCRWYEINELKSDGTEDKRYKPSMCVLHSRSFRDNYYCANGERADNG